jgi:predicted transcriptional regulator YdeE
MVLFIWNAFKLVGVSETFLKKISGRLIKSSWQELDQRLSVEERFKVSCA